jgi:hypothetical protein
MERLDQGHLHPLLGHHETNMSWQGIEPVAKSYSKTAYAIDIRNFYRTDVCTYEEQYTIQYFSWGFAWVKLA